MRDVKRRGPSREHVRLSRRESARATHWRIVKAAYKLFAEHGYAATTMAAIAEEAGVAVQTVYFAFHTKAALLSRAYDFAVLGEEDPRRPEEQAWYQEMRAASGITDALRHFVAGVAEMTARVTPIEMTARVAADSDPDTARVMQFHEEWRADGYRSILELLIAKARLRPGLDSDRATELLLFFVGPDAYHFLVRTYGWSHDAWVNWTVAAIGDQVFGLSSAGGSGSGEVATELDGAGIRIQPLVGSDLREEGDLPIIPASVSPIEAATVRGLIDADRHER